MAEKQQPPSSSSLLQQQIEKKRISRGKLTAVPGGTPGAKHIAPGEDIRRVPNQRYIVFSYVTPDGSTRVRCPDGFMMKFSGAFHEEKEAWDHAEAIRNEDNRFDVNVADMYKWGRVPLPETQKPFVKRVYSDEIMTKLISGMQTTMVQGRKEVEERKAKARAKAEEAMKEKMGPDYKMPEKSKELLDFEEEVRRERDAQDVLARAQGKVSCRSYAEKDIADIVTTFFIDHAGETIEVETGPIFMRNLIEKLIEREAKLLRATKKERGGNMPPTAADIDKALTTAEEQPSSSSSSTAEEPK
jgi:hypothetical protein